MGIGARLEGCPLGLLIDWIFGISESSLVGQMTHRSLFNKADFVILVQSKPGLVILSASFQSPSLGTHIRKLYQGGREGGDPS